jgi:hypothetical protein
VSVWRAGTDLDEWDIVDRVAEPVGPVEPVEDETAKDSGNAGDAAAGSTKQFEFKVKDILNALCCRICL